MTLQYIENLSVEIINHMNAETLYKTAIGIKKVAERKARSIEVHNLEKTSVPYKFMIKNGGYEFTKKDFIGKGGTLSVNKMRGYISRMRNYITAETSNYKGYQKWVKETAERFSETNEDWYNLASIDERRSFWDAYADIEGDGRFETWKQLTMKNGASDRVQDIVMEEYRQWNPDEMTYEDFIDHVKDVLETITANPTFE